MTRARLTMCMALLLVCDTPAACAQQPKATQAPAPASPTITTDTSSRALVPPGYGTLRQEDISVRLDLGDVQARLIPLDESVIRVLSPDSYRQLQGLVESQRDHITRLAAVHGIRGPSIWYVRFNGLAPEAQFTPTDVTITASGRDFRPVEMIPLTAGFGAQRLRARDTQAALYMFEDGVDVSQPLVVSMGTARTNQWDDILRTVERERAIIRSRTRQAR
jgi:hypothetical protein